MAMQFGSLESGEALGIEDYLVHERMGRSGIRGAHSGTNSEPAFAGVRIALVPTKSLSELFGTKLIVLSR
ncbi:MAG: hypothetical protein IPG25_19420 [Proteobacteria bacterium]|nr:hypothetical protein [Pseudomonadota bacterium]